MSAHLSALPTAQKSAAINVLLLKTGPRITKIEGKSEKMNLSFFMAKRLAFSRHSGLSRVILRLAMAGVAVSVAVMIIAIATVSGFREGIRAKVSGFGGGVTISHYENNNSYEPIPFIDSGSSETALKKAGIRQKLHPVAIKPGIIKTDEEIEGIVMKGIRADYDTGFLHDALVTGRLPKLSDTVSNAECIISRHTAQRLKLKTGDRMKVIFIRYDTSGRSRTTGLAATITGIYQTGMEEYDKYFCIAPLKFVQNKLSNADAITQYEIRGVPFEQIVALSEQVNKHLPGSLHAVSIIAQYRDIFDWLNILDHNVEIILALMLFVAAINMSTALLILILERTRMIGMMKAMGAGNWKIRRIFIFHVVFILLAGLLAGNICGLGLCFLQQQFGLIRLPQETYYVSQVLIHIVPWQVAAVSLGTVVLCTVLLILPSSVVLRIAPVKAIRFN